MGGGREGLSLAAAYFIRPFLGLGGSSWGKGFGQTSDLISLLMLICMYGSHFCWPKIKTTSCLCDKQVQVVLSVVGQSCIMSQIYLC